MVQVQDEPTEREKAFDTWIRMIIGNGLNEDKPVIIQLERNKEGMKRLYTDINMAVPELTAQKHNSCYSFLVNRKKYTVDDKKLYSALRELNREERKLAFLVYWENANDFRIMQQLRMTKKALKNKKREMVERLEKAVGRIV